MLLIRTNSFWDIRMVTGILMVLSFTLGARVIQPPEPVVVIQCFQYTSDYSTSMLHATACPKGVE